MPRTPTADATRSAGPAPRSPGSATALRQANQRRVLDLLVRTGADPLPQAEIVRATSLASGTVSNIVRELAAAGVVRTVAGSGRRGTTVQLDRGAGLVAGFDFGHAHVGVGVAEFSGRVLCQQRHPLRPDHGPEALTTAEAMLEELLDRVGAERRDIRTIGMGLPAPIADGVVLSSAILPGWVGVAPAEVARDVFEVEVLVENDANLGALAEYHRGRGRGHRNLVFVKVSSGVGAGLILDGRLYRGAGGVSGELGHLTIDDRGPLCRCGSRGCLEAYAASGTALDMLSEVLPGAGLGEVIRAAREGNAAAARVFEDAGLHLGWGLAMLTTLLDPDIVVVGGDMAQAGDLLLEPARRGLRRHALPGTTDTPVEPASLGEQASIVGAVTLAIGATDLVPEPA